MVMDGIIKGTKGVVRLVKRVPKRSDSTCFNNESSNKENVDR